MALKSLRKQHWPNNRAAAKALGLGASTVAKVENLKGEPDYDPGIGIVNAFIAAAAQQDPSLTLSSFFAQIERQTDGSLQGRDGESRTVPSPDESTQRGRQGRAVPLDAPSLLAAGDALVEAGGRLIAAASGIAVGKDARPTDRVRRAKPAKGARRAANR